MEKKKRAYLRQSHKEGVNYHQSEMVHHQTKFATKSVWYGFHVARVRVFLQVSSLLSVLSLWDLYS